MAVFPKDSPHTDSFSPIDHWQLRTRSLPLRGRPLLMGIVNVTPDSFSDGGKFLQTDRAVQHALDLARQGADILDIGGESTRPYSNPVALQEELDRVVPVVEKIRAREDLILSIDTSKVEVARECVAQGVEIINDVTGFCGDGAMASLAAESRVGVCAMHMQGTPQTMQKNPYYEHVLLDIYDFFEREILKFSKYKHKNKIILDPGIGFGKNLKHNLMLINKISIFHSLGFPILIGTSRKRFIENIVSNFDTRERLGGTLSSVLFLYSQGIKFFRVHNVEEVKQGLLVFETLLNK